MKSPDSSKERNLIKGALRRVFSRSDLRRRIIAAAHIPGVVDPERPRVKKWGKCSSCGELVPSYLMEADHVMPVIPIDRSLEDLTWDELVDRIWCTEDNLKAICKSCHRVKSGNETKQRAAHRSARRKAKSEKS